MRVKIYWGISGPSKKFLSVTMFCNALNSSEFSFSQYFALTSFFVRQWWLHFLNLFPILHLCLFWMWNKTLTVCSYHITYAFQSESTLYSCLNIKELLARSMREISSLWDYNGTQTHNHLVRKRVPLQSHEIKHFFHVITLCILPKLYRLTKNNLK